jgi:hypothetical protein
MQCMDNLGSGPMTLPEKDHDFHHSKCNSLNQIHQNCVKIFNNSIVKLTLY